MALDPMMRNLERLTERVRELEDRLADTPEREAGREPLRAVACGP